uniref:Lipoxygenase domain-containing protein n=1 Tax=Oryzias latipes TaxID=8090 RepID=A0A3P9IVM3_ORYLA
MKCEYEYEVTIFVEGYVSSWSLYKSLYITLEGTKGESKPISYSNWNLPFFRRNVSEIKFTVKCFDDLGNLVNIKLDKYWSIPFQKPWYHEKVVVVSQMGTVYTFPIHHSISDHKDWKEYKPGMPHCLKADSLPWDEIYSLNKDMQLLITSAYGGFSLLKSPGLRFTEYVMQNWKEDSFFGSQFLNGLNPMMIRRIESLPEKFPVKNHMVFPDDDDTLEFEMEKGNIFLCDYSILDGVEANTINDKQQYLTAPLVLLHKNQNDDMMPIAIQLKQKPGEDNPIFLPSDSELDWLLAKLYVRSADFNLHALNYHLLRTHLLAEVFAVALQRNLPRVHPVYKILIRHTRYTLQINFNARKTLISKDGVFTKFTASGGKGMDTILQRSLSNLTYKSLCIPDDIKERGLEDVKNFHYRDDGLKLWDIIFVKETLSYYYKEDNDLEDDFELRNWIQEIFEHGFLITFSCYLNLLTQSVNSGQFDFYGWMPNGPSTMREPPPTKKNTVKEATILKTLPDIGTIVKGMVTVYVLSTQACDSVSGHNLMYFTENIPCENVLNFQKNLNKLSEEIQERNKGLDLPYTYLDPKQVETSVSI